MAETTESGGAAEAADQRREDRAQEVEVEAEKELGQSNGPSHLSDSIKETEFPSPLTEAEPEALAKDQTDGVLVNSAVESTGGAEFKEHVGETHQTHQEAVTSLIPLHGEAEAQTQIQSSLCPTPLLELSPTSVTKCLPQTINSVSVSSISKTPTHDGYNWRKYGQKQVKSPKGSRSYYRCTYSDCCAKKIECSNDSGYVIEVVNKGSHCHDPPRKNNSTRESRSISSLPRVSADTALEDPVRVPGDSDPSTSVKEPIHEPSMVLERKRHNLSGSDGYCEVEVKGNHLGEPDPKRRSKKDSSTCPDSISKTGKKHKFVVHAAGNVGISGDGYRWRKYGQKMVKGNPNPRNYYRCTSAGCSARKHTETAMDSSTAVLITYKGVHDHDMPVPKKRHGPPSALLLAAAAPASKNNTQTRDIDTVQNRTTTSQQHLVGREGELAGEKTLESARTLLSIGFEIKQC